MYIGKLELDVKEAAKLLGISVAKVRKLIKDGKLEASKAPHRVTKKTMWFTSLNAVDKYARSIAQPEPKKKEIKSDIATEALVQLNLNLSMMRDTQIEVLRVMKNIQILL